LKLAKTKFTYRTWSFKNDSLTAFETIDFLVTLTADRLLRNKFSILCGYGVIKNFEFKTLKNEFFKKQIFIEVLRNKFLEKLPFSSPITSSLGQLLLVSSNWNLKEYLTLDFTKVDLIRLFSIHEPILIIFDRKYILPYRLEDLQKFLIINSKLLKNVVDKENPLEISLLPIYCQLKNIFRILFFIKNRILKI